jgi:hypothetical protein
MARQWRVTCCEQVNALIERSMSSASCHKPAIRPSGKVPGGRQHNDNENRDLRGSRLTNTREFFMFRSSNGWAKLC